jgi:predicted permease
MGTALLRGREFASLDREGAPHVTIINQTMAEQFWPGQDPIGHRLMEGGPGTGTAYEIVGVVETGKYRTLGEVPRPAIFRSRLQHDGPRSTFVASVGSDSQGALAAIRNVVQELDPRLALSRLGTLEQHLTLALFPVRTTGLLLGIVGSVALVLAVSGLFGVIAYSVSQRTREFGIRMALGAQRREIGKMVLRQGLKLAAAGVLAGLGGALAATRLLVGVLFGVSPSDPWTFVAVPLLLLFVAGLASWLPARHATRVDPMEALRYE